MSVRGSKSSTGQFESWEIDVINDLAREVTLDEKNKDEYFLEDRPIPEFKVAYSEMELDLTEQGHYMVVTCEAWKGIEQTEEGALYTPLQPENATWKAVVHTDTLSKSKPPEQWGDRWTDKLSIRGKKAIEGSAKYQHKIGQGYRTFLTLTFTPEWRGQIEKWDQMKRGKDDENRKTIGNLSTDFINTLQQRHRNGITFPGHYRRAGKQQRGGGYQANGSAFKGRIDAASKSARWTPVKWREGFKLKGSGKPFQFVWVIENPENEQGEKNPHIHVLMNWGVKLDQFHAWAMWIEKAWGKGFAKLERIKKPAAAAHYMAKAANYLSKGTEGTQGQVRGNRYSVGRDARAPKARMVGMYWSDMIRDAIGVGVQAGREKWPKGLWFHRHGFGASNRAAWGHLWSVLKADGLRLRDAPKNLFAARLNNAAVKLMRQLNDYHSQVIESFFKEAVDWDGWERVTID
ncbi:MAG: hypothetical protein LC541_20340 [Candidatus Thiodiazotropha sp.]|nr:hypothetical protein [Candidatus Thiodiazotropha sp.]MCM8922152.1 hypothetical protein [Candidatus Thiodiazotropha sp.]